jgi:hypothetical protein
MTKQTSDRVSSLAASYVGITSRQLENLTPERSVAMAADIRSMAASLLAQDEVRGLRKLIRKVIG